MLKDISFRLGMSGRLYIGICLGVIMSGILMVVLLLITSPGSVLGIMAAMALILAGVLVGVIIVYFQEKARTTPDNLCTCRYRSSVNTRCGECALKEREKGTE